VRVCQGAIQVLSLNYIHIYIYMYVYIYIVHTHTHTHTAGRDCPAVRGRGGPQRGGGDAEGADGKRRKEVGGRVRRGY
jgi:hypothetical protein